MTLSDTSEECCEFVGKVTGGPKDSYVAVKTTYTARNLGSVGERSRDSCGIHCKVAERLMLYANRVMIIRLKMEIQELPDHVLANVCIL